MLFLNGGVRKSQTRFRVFVGKEGCGLVTCQLCPNRKLSHRESRGFVVYFSKMYDLD